MEDESISFVIIKGYSAVNLVMENNPAEQVERPFFSIDKKTLRIFSENPETKSSNASNNSSDTPNRKALNMRIKEVTQDQEDYESLSFEEKKSEDCKEIKCNSSSKDKQEA